MSKKILPFKPCCQTGTTTPTPQTCTADVIFVIETSERLGPIIPLVGLVKHHLLKLISGTSYLSCSSLRRPETSACSWRRTWEQQELRSRWCTSVHLIRALHWPLISIRCAWTSEWCSRNCILIWEILYFQFDWRDFLCWNKWIIWNLNRKLNFRVQVSPMLTAQLRIWKTASLQSLDSAISNCLFINYLNIYLYFYLSINLL